MKKYEASVTLSDFRRNFRKYVAESELGNVFASMGQQGDSFCGKLKDNSKFILYHRRQGRGSFFSTIIRGQAFLTDEGVLIKYRFSKFLFFQIAFYLMAAAFFIYGIVTSLVYLPMGLFCISIGIYCLLPMLIRTKTAKAELEKFLKETLCQHYIRK